MPILSLCRSATAISLLLVSLTAYTAAAQPAATQPDAEPTAGGGADVALDQPLSLELLDTPLSSALDRLQREAGVTLLLDPDLDADFTKQPVTLRLENTPLDRALNLIGLITGSDFIITDGVVFVSSSQVIKQRKVVRRVYDIRGLLVAVQNLAGPSLDLIDALSNTNSGGGGGRQSQSGDQGGGDGGGGGGEGLFGAGEEAEDMATREERIQELTDLITETTAGPDDWIDQVFTLREVGGTLVINATPEVHDEVGELLESLHDFAGQMVQVEGEFFIMPRSVVAEVLADNDGSLIIAADRLDVVAERLASGASSRLAAVRNVGFNGQRVYLYAGRDTAFVSDVEPIPDAEGVDTTLSVLRNGAVLDVLPTIIRGGEEVVVAVKGDVINAATVDAAGGTDSDSAPATQPANLQTPARDTVNYRTTVRLPRGGAVVLTGVSGLLQSADANDSEVALLLRVRVVE